MNQVRHVHGVYGTMQAISREADLAQACSIF